MNTTTTIQTKVEQYSDYILQQLQRDAQRAADAASEAIDNITKRVSSQHFANDVFIDSELRARAHNLIVTKELQRLLAGAQEHDSAEFVERLGQYFTACLSQLGDQATWMRDGRENRSNGAGEAIIGFILQAERNAWNFVCSQDADYRNATEQYSNAQAKRSDVHGKLDRVRNEERKQELRDQAAALDLVAAQLKQAVLVQARAAEERLARQFTRATAPASYASLWTR